MTAGLPGALRGAVEEALEDLAPPGRVVDVRPIGGGCIHRGSRIATERGDAYFLKWSRHAPSGMFEAEADGLGALREAAGDAVTVPEPLAWRNGAWSWLLMDYVEPGRGRSDAALGQGLARIHGSPVRCDFGWARDNWIGSLPQANPPGPSWGDFWRDARLRPQLERARREGRLPEERFDRLLGIVAGALRNVTEPELLHGDLWSGNALTSEGGAPVLVDPAVYQGDGEVDLAMSELFGGFGTAFYDAYDAARPISPEYVAFKRDVYQLYYLLVHVNLFGASYEAGARSAARAALGGMGEP